jgi:hypothetical protein
VKDVGLIFKFVFEVLVIVTVGELSCEKVSSTFVKSGSLYGGMGILKTELIATLTSVKAVIPFVN